MIGHYRQEQADMVKQSSAVIWPELELHGRNSCERFRTARTVRSLLEVLVVGRLSLH